MKKIAILSPDTVPLPLKDNFPEKIQEGTKQFSTKDKCIRTTAPGKFCIARRRASTDSISR